MKKNRLLASLPLLLACVALVGRAAPSYDLHTKALPRIETRTTPAGAPVRLVESGEPRFVIVAGPQVRVRHTVRYAWKVLREAFLHTTGREPVLLDAEKDRAKWLAAESVILLGDSAAARELGFDSDRLADQEFLVSTFEKKVAKGGTDGSRQTVRGVAILGNETIKVGIPPPKGERDARTMPNSVLYGAVDFCERILDCRYYYPGEDGFYFPKIADLTVDPVAYGSAPHFNTRGNSYGFYCASNTSEKKAKWAAYMGKAPDEPDIKARWRLGLTMELLGKHNPEPFGLYDAFPTERKRIFYTSPNGHFWCSRSNYFANYYDVFNIGPGSFSEILLDGWKAFYASGRTKSRGGLGNLVGQEWINFGVTDVYMNPEDCIADPIVKSERLITEADFARANTVDGRTILANVYGRFYTNLCARLARELPGRKLFALAYYNCKYAPTRYRLPANFDAIVCDGSLLSFAMDPRARAKSKALFEGWRQAMGGRPPSMAYLYACGDPFGNGITPEYIGECVNMLGDSLGRTGVFFDGTVNWHSFYGWYAGAHQQWDPHFDAVAAFDDMADKMFGRAAGPMKKFHRRLRANCEKYLMPTLFDRSLVYPLSEVDALEKLLNEAKAAVADDERAARHLKLVADPWPEIFRKHREKMAKRVVAEDGVYPVARRTGETVDWSKIPAVPGSNGLKLVWDERGLYGRADGEVHYRLTTEFDHPERASIPLDYDTMVPGFSVDFSKAFHQKAYKAIALKPFGRLRLLGRGDDPNVDETASARRPLGCLDGAVTVTSDKDVRKLTFANGLASYTHSFKFITGRRADLRWLQTATLAPGDTGFFCYASWLNGSVNGIPLGDVNLGAANAKDYAKGEARGYEYALNFDGARVKLRLYMRPNDPILWGELEEGNSAGRVFAGGSTPVTNATLTLNSIPSVLIRDAKKAKFPYRRQLRTARRILELPEASSRGEKTFDLGADDRFFLAQDANWDGTADDRGVGPCWMYVDMDKVQKATTTIGADKRDVGVACTLKPGFGKVRFGIWEDRSHRHANDATYERVRNWVR